MSATPPQLNLVVLRSPDIERAAGICYDGRIVQDGKKVDAVIFTLEHNSGNATKTSVPYTKGFFGKIRLGQLTAQLEEPKIFVSA